MLNRFDLGGHRDSKYYTSDVISVSNGLSPRAEEEGGDCDVFYKNVIKDKNLFDYYFTDKYFSTFAMHVFSHDEIVAECEALAGVDCPKHWICPICGRRSEQYSFVPCGFCAIEIAKIRGYDPLTPDPYDQVRVASHNRYNDPTGYVYVNHCSIRDVLADMIDAVYPDVSPAEYAQLLSDCREECVFIEHSDKLRDEYIDNLGKRPPWVRAE